jgi:hypothetical protein
MSDIDVRCRYRRVLLHHLALTRGQGGEETDAGEDSMTVVGIKWREVGKLVHSVRFESCGGPQGTEPGNLSPENCETRGL